MGENKVKLISISIKKLYGCFNYTVNFNPDVTFIYGLNGCGKTTILNITEAIITGQLFKLFNYQFDNIELNYAKDYDFNDLKKIILSYENEKIKVSFNNKDYMIGTSDLENSIHPLKNTKDISRLYFNRYDFLIQIKNTFNYVYLPLNRSNVPYDETKDLYNYPIFPNINLIDNNIFIDIDNRDEAMIKIESLIYQNYIKANTAINGINDSFRNSMLKPQIELNDNYDIFNLINDIENYNIPELKRTQDAYIKILKEFNIIDKFEEESYNNFFENFINSLSKFKNKKNRDGTPVDLLFKYQEISRIQKTIDIAKKMEQRKAIITKPMEIFLNTMNSFINNSEDGKEIGINKKGRIYFRTKYNNNQISIQHLSSGEKQLITFFANLIFNVKEKSSGIFVVDEPELSLHLSWQKIFIDKVLEINRNIQLIFATHAPEIIGYRRNKMYKLEKEYIKAE